MRWWLGLQGRRQLDFDARVRERTRIARTLHDSLLQAFQGVMFRLQAVRHLLPGEVSEATAQLDSALEAGDRAIAEGWDAARRLQELDGVEDNMPESLATLGREFSATSMTRQTSYRVLVEGRPQTLDPLIRDEVYRITREALQNAFKYAHAAHIDAELSYGPSHFCVRIRDDGVGMGSHVLAQDGRDGHWGLPGMRERAVSLDGKLNVWSELGVGTEIELKIPVRIAYAGRHR